MAATPPNPDRYTSGNKVDLARMRHELRTPINHVLGYCEMLMEESILPPQAREDLRRIHAGGRELQALIGRYFDQEGFSPQLNLHRLYHEIRTPANHVIGYSELLIEQAQELGAEAAVADLGKIRDAAGQWLTLMEGYLLGPQSVGRIPEAAPVEGQVHAATFGHLPKPSEPATSIDRLKDEGAVLIVDDDDDSREMLARRLRRDGYTVSMAPDGLHALALARAQQFDLILLDMIMPGLDGFQTLSQLKAHPHLKEIPVIMLSALDEESGIARCIEMGAEDYLAKPFNPVFLRARIGACLEKKRLRDTERRTYEALLESQKHLASELAEAAAYVRSLLPPPLEGPVQAEWCFQPSQQLGGDAFGYHWIDDAHLAIYLLDVCGHGVGAALLSVSVLNSIRAQNLVGVDFRRPADVLAALNRAFPAERQHNLFFTIWYGVFEVSNRQLSFSSGGHPPAVLLAPEHDGSAKPIWLGTKAPAIGCFDDARFGSGCRAVPAAATLLVFSDGVFEIFQDQDRVATWDEFAKGFDSPAIQRLRPEERFARALKLRGTATLEDDFSCLELRFQNWSTRRPGGSI
jgi:sigma-B regulation protein RsbU (phosphoserine phosphatase)